MPSQKLEFTKQEPSFLRRLREEHGGPRNNVQAPRPKKDRLRTGDDDEDEPVIVDESGENVVAKEEWEGMLKREKEGVEAEAGRDDDVEKADEAVASAMAKEVQKAEIGTTKKRKVVKVIGQEEPADTPKSKRDDQSATTTSDGTDKAQAVPEPSKPRKKAKKIKLSFDDPD
ncbi:uncharacterized protein AB675_11013 [Cyphellophora attinorum]|uniref:DUF4604 domain-containing protein n=1 Tax=Cyphellophora attinorum TaxID=1664694 RepID=A0A0N1H2L0_9EURO|nr:uncharacterized protein AB675_11013 [Phialophora attinorum]KPI35510.1 hypothetical protein AB675_11013 [Phialophora attinorum]